MPREKRNYGSGFEHCEREFANPCFNCGQTTHHALRFLSKHLPLCSKCNEKAKRILTADWSNRVRKHLAKAKRRGVTLGRPKIEIPDEAIYEHYKESKSLRQTAAYFGISVGHTHKVVVALRILERDENT